MADIPDLACWSHNSALGATHTSHDLLYETFCKLLL